MSGSVVITLGPTTRTSLKSPTRSLAPPGGVLNSRLPPLHYAL
jgi:hypothetical protein